jgi:hypothetical protein
MKVGRLSVAALLLGASLVAVSCGDNSPIAPQSAPSVVQHGLLGNVFSAVGRTASALDLVSCSPLPAQSVTRVIGPRGGTITVGPHTLTVPARALARDVAITATVVPESVNRVHFEPAGLRFSNAATLEMSYRHCNTLGRLLPKRIAYVSGDLRVLFSYLGSIDNLRESEVSADLDHFSDYVLAW